MFNFEESEFDNVYRLMKLSFPEDERRPYKDQKALLLKKEYKIHVLKNETSDSLRAFAAIWNFKGFAYIEHFAVSPDARNCGLGSRMLKKLISESDKPICLEVEPPVSEITARRIAFYERNGFFLNDYEYIQPALAQNRKAVPLKIMTTGKQISLDEFKRIKNTLYKYVYNQPD